MKVGEVVQEASDLLVYPFYDALNNVTGVYGEQPDRYSPIEKAGLTAAEVTLGAVSVAVVVGQRISRFCQAEN